MAARKPLVINAGQIEQLQAGDTLDGVTLDFTLTNANAGAIVIGTPVYSSAAGSCDEAQADAAGTKDVLGLVVDTSVATTDPATIRGEGTLTATTTQWDAVTGQTGGLTAGSTYYLDPDTAGMLTTTAPSADGDFVCPIGKALSTTVMRIIIGTTVRL